MVVKVGFEFCWVLLFSVASKDIMLLPGENILEIVELLPDEVEPKEPVDRNRQELEADNVIVSE